MVGTRHSCQVPRRRRWLLCIAASAAPDGLSSRGLKATAAAPLTAGHKLQQRLPRDMEFGS
jgi:hypothetical protein